MLGDVFFQSRDQFGYAPENATSQSIAGEVAKEALDHVQPGSVGGRKMEVKTRVFAQPFVHLGMFVGGVVIQNQMQLAIGRSLRVDLLEKLQPKNVNGGK